MEPNIITITPSQTEKQVLRTAAYCRVSSDSEDQLHSFAAQVKHYTKFIGDNTRMELADIYADEGLTGTKIAKRDDFLRLVSDCEKGRIDRVLTKSVSRFARNTADSLKYARLLKEHGVSILFEKENIDTAYMSSELLLALSGAQAQEESISISKNMRWSCEKRMKNGTYLSSSTPYGYELKDGEFQIVETEAEVVRQIFKSYLSGMSKKAIADMLNQQNTPKRFGYEIWRINAVEYILGNERYIGDALFQKSYTTDTLPFIRKQNCGKKTQYYVEDTNPTIISKKDFEAAQRLAEKKRITQRNAPERNPLTEIILCSCDHVYRRISVNGKLYWGCKQHNYDSKKCNSRRIPEKDIYEAFITMVNKMRNLRADILPAAIAQAERLQMKAGGMAARIREIDKEVAELSNKNLVLSRLSTKGILRPSEYAAQSSAIGSKINDLRTERRQLLREQAADSTLSGLRRLNDILQVLDAPLTEFDTELFGDMVEQITVPTDTSICFRLLGGLPITENIPAQRRHRQK